MAEYQRMLSERDYVAKAEAELTRLIAALDELGDDVVAELMGDILDLEFEDGSKFIINSHRAARQIWMAAGRNAWHFDYDPGTSRWLASKGGEELWQTLCDLLSTKLGRKVQLVA